MTDPTTTTLPNLSTWHSVPDGATIPANTPYAHSDGNSLTVVLEGYCRDLPAYGLAIRFYTEFPVTPPLPTEEGATDPGIRQRSATAHPPDIQGWSLGHLLWCGVGRQDHLLVPGRRRRDGGHAMNCSHSMTAADWIAEQRRIAQAATSAGTRRRGSFAAPSV